ncbi:MAG: hypothetical protein HFI39_07390 [Lachnospiraceae bacterium]|nr:hypothetical protein [Lachnospiraceae bacterium]
MLRKLVKYDLKANYLCLLVCYAVYIVLTIAFSLNIKGIIREETAQTASQIVPEAVRIFMTVSLTILWGGSMIGLLILTFVLIIHRFYTNLVSDQGYLSLTLPVSTRQHMLSKLISGLLFQFLTLVVIVASFIIMGGIIDILPIVSRFGELLMYIWEEVTDYYGLIYGLDMLVGIVRGLLMIYFSICVGQLFNKHKIWGAIGTYLGLLIVLELFVGIAALILGITPSGDLVWLASLMGGSWWSLISKAAQAAVYFFLGAWILEKKANLE